VSTVLVIHADTATRRRWRADIQAAGHKTVASPTLFQAMTALASASPDLVVVSLTTQQEVDILRYVGSIRDLPPLVAVTDGELPPLPARVQAAALLAAPVSGDTLRRALGDVAHACTIGAPPPSRHPFRLPPEGIRKWCFVIRAAAIADDDETIPRSDFAA
jgi:DNA-binding NtrC family response regulator